MGVFDFYCFLCSGSLAAVEIGSSSSRALKRRRRYVERERSKLETGEELDTDHTDSGNDEGVDEYDELQSYDPGLATDERIAWLRKIRALGLNEYVAGAPKAFISGLATYDDNGVIEVQVGSDPNQPSVDECPAFNGYDLQIDDYDVAFPFHTHCMTVLEEANQWYLARPIAIDGSDPCLKPSLGGKWGDAPKLDSDVLYHTASQLTRDDCQALELDYGDISGPSQFWDSISGEEFSAADPLEIPHGNSDPGMKPTVEQTGLPSRPRSPTDPFMKIPTEILHAVCRCLSGRDLRAFLTASGAAYHATLDPAFWKLMGASRTPWAWEFWRDIPQQTTETESSTDYKRLYLRLDKNTSRGFGMTLSTGDWMGLTNRRRIWDVCLQFLPHYHRA